MEIGAFSPGNRTAPVFCQIIFVKNPFFVIFVILRRYAGLVAESGPTQASLPMAAAAYLREPAVIFLLGFCTFGAAVLPLVCLWQGFTLSFAVACFAASLGRDGVLLSLAAFGIRGVILIPCTLLTAQWAFDKALARLLGEKAAPSRRTALVGLVLTRPSRRCCCWARCWR